MLETTSEGGDGEGIGTVVTGLYAPTVEKYCGHAFVPPQYAKVGTELQIVIRNKPKAAVHLIFKATKKTNSI